MPPWGGAFRTVFFVASKTLIDGLEQQRKTNYRQVDARGRPRIYHSWFDSSRHLNIVAGLSVVSSASPTGLGKAPNEKSTR